MGNSENENNKCVKRRIKTFKEIRKLLSEEELFYDADEKRWKMLFKNNVLLLPHRILEMFGEEHEIDDSKNLVSVLFDKYEDIPDDLAENVVCIKTENGGFCFLPSVMFETTEEKLELLLNSKGE